MVPNWISKASAPCRSLDHDIRDVYYRASAGFVQWISRSLILFKPKNAGNNVGTLCTPQFYRPTASIDVSTLEPDLLAWGPFKMLFPPLVGVCSGVHFHFECTFMTLTPFPLAGFFKISLAVCYFSNGFGPWPSHYLQGVYKRTNYRLTCTSFKGKQILKHVFFSRPYITKFYTQKYSRLRCLLHIKGLVICVYLGWSCSILVSYLFTFIIFNE